MRKSMNSLRDFDLQNIKIFTNIDKRIKNSKKKKSKKI